MPEPTVQVPVSQTGIRLILSPGQVAQLSAFAQRGFPHEVCGLLIGRNDSDRLQVERVTQARNLATHRLQDRFELDPRDYLAGDFESILQSESAYECNDEHFPQCKLLLSWLIRRPGREGVLIAG